MKLESLKDLHREQLKDLCSAETQLLDALPKMADAASAPAETHVNQEAFST